MPKVGTVLLSHTRYEGWETLLMGDWVAPKRKLSMGSQGRRGIGTLSWNCVKKGGNNGRLLSVSEHMGGGGGDQRKNKGKRTRSGSRLTIRSNDLGQKAIERGHNEGQ